MKTDLFAAKGTGNLFPPLSAQLLGILGHFFFVFCTSPGTPCFSCSLKQEPPILMCFTAALPQPRRGPRLWSRVSTRRWGGSRDWIPITSGSVCWSYIH